MNLYQDTLEMLQKDARPREQIAYESEVSYSWVSKFINKRFVNPGVHTVQKLYDYLLSNGSRKSKRD